MKQRKTFVCEKATQFVFGCVWFCMVALGCFAVPEAASARETYAEYADRILNALPEGVSVQPELEAMVAQSTNAYRSEQGMAKFKPASDVLRKAARAHALDLLLSGAMGHVASTGHNFESRVRALHKGQMFLAPMAENAARLRKTKLGRAEQAMALVKQWINSPPHRKNMANRTYVAMAVGVVVRGNDVYAVQIFTGPTMKSNVLPH